MADDWDSHGERRTISLSEEMIDRIAEQAAERAVARLTEQIYMQVGQSVVRKAFYIAGLLTLAAFFWAQSHGWVRFP